VKLTDTLAQLWTTVLETPAARNPFAVETASGCWDLGGTVSAFGPNPPGVPSCTVKPGTKVFVLGSSNECSTFEEPFPKTEADLRTCARKGDSQTAPPVTVDGKPVPMTETATPLLHIKLPADNVFGAPAGSTGLSVGHGWAALLHPLTPGSHRIDIGGANPATTTIVVRPGA
jgi:hypothetical protein